MPAAQPDPFVRVSRRFATAGKIGAGQMMLGWDAQTHMPRGGAWARGEEVTDGRRASVRDAPKRKRRDVFVYFDNDMKVRAPFDAEQLRIRVARLLAEN